MTLGVEWVIFERRCVRRTREAQSLAPVSHRIGGTFGILITRSRHTEAQLFAGGLDVPGDARDMIAGHDANIGPGGQRPPRQPSGSVGPLSPRTGACQASERGGEHVSRDDLLPTADPASAQAEGFALVLGTWRLPEEVKVAAFICL
jgi:hypothetical protein